MYLSQPEHGPSHRPAPLKGVPMHRRRTARPLALAAAALVMAACAPSTSGDDGDKTTLTVWSWRTEDVAAYKTMFDRFTKTHPDINVEFKPTKNTEYDQVL